MTTRPNNTAYLPTSDRLSKAVQRGFMAATRRCNATWRAWGEHCNRTLTPDVRGFIGRRQALVEYDLLSSNQELTAQGILLVLDLFDANDRPYPPNSTYGFARVPIETAERVAVKLVAIIREHSRKADYRDNVDAAADKLATEQDEIYLKSRGWSIDTDFLDRTTARAPGKRTRSLTAAVNAQLALDAELFVDGLLTMEEEQNGYQ